MQNKLNDNFILKNNGYSNSEDTINLPRHRWYYYKEGYSPHFVEKAIEFSGISKNDIIIDPFNGSGTTTLASSLLGYKSIGIEVNPFTSFLSITKAKNIDSYSIEKEESSLLKAVERGKISPLLKFSTFSKRDELNKWLFNESVLNSFEGGWNYSNSISGYNARKIVRLALISSAMQNSNVKRDGKCFRYKNNWDNNNKDKDSFIETLVLNLSNIKNDIKATPIHVQSKIFSGDSRIILKNSTETSGFKLCITSPPYLNTFDYTDIYRPELFLGKFITNNEKLYDLRLETIRSHIQAKWEKPLLSDFGILFQQTMKYVIDNVENLMHKNIPLMIQAYFEDMSNVLQLLMHRAAKEAQLWLVVSNSAYADYEVPVDLIIADIASRVGWNLKEIGVLRYVKKRKTKYSPKVKELRESVIILTNNN